MLMNFETLVCCLCLPFEVGSLCSIVFSYHLCQTSLVIAAKTLSLTLTEIHREGGGGGQNVDTCFSFLSH